MLIRVDDESLVDDLCGHYRRSGFTAERAGGGMVEIARPEPVSDSEARREILAHLRVWNLINRDAHAEPVD